MIAQLNYPTVLKNNRSPEVALPVPMANSALLFFGSFFDPFTGVNGAQGFVANQRVRGVVTDIEVWYNGNYVSIAYLATIPGVVFTGVYIAPTGVFPARYTTSSTNVTATYPDRVIFDEITIDDKVEAVLGAVGVPVARGTTAASNVLNNFLEPDPVYPWTLIESGVSAVATGLNFQITERSDYKNRTIVKLINADGAVS